MLRASIIACAVAWSAAAFAQVTRSTDEIAALIASATPGDVIHVPPGVYHGSLRVTAGVILEGGGEAVIDAGGEGTVVEILAEGVTFRGFTVRGSGTGVDREPAGIRAETGPVVIENNRLEDVLFGIDVRSGPGSIVRANYVIGKDLDVGRRGDGIRLWWSSRSLVEDNVVTRSRDVVFWYSEALEILGNVVDDSRYGLHFMYTNDATLRRNRLERNSVGVYLMYSAGIILEDNLLTRNRGPSGYGLGLKDCDDIIVRGNQFLSNRVGMYIDSSPLAYDGVGVIEGNTLAYNDVALLATPNTRGNVLTGNGFIDNEQQGAVHGRGALHGNTYARDGVGNYWSDYPGFDRDGDGVGDLPYRPAALFDSIMAKEPNLRLFVRSPAHHAIDFTARALPEVRPAPILEDPAPLMAPPTQAWHAQAVGSRRGAALAGLGLLAGSGLALAWGARESGRRGLKRNRRPGTGETFSPPARGHTHGTLSEAHR